MWIVRPAGAQTSDLSQTMVVKEGVGWREVRAYERLRGVPGVVQATLATTVTNPPVPCLLMPHHDVLDDVVRRGCVPVDVRSSWAACLVSETLSFLSAESQLCCVMHQVSALRRMHQLGVLHRDIKPTNILIDSNGEALLCDFDAAVFRQPDGRWECMSFEGTRRFASREAQLSDHPREVFDFQSLALTMCYIAHPHWGSPTLKHAAADYVARAVLKG